jgi:hypothetical protein
MTCGAHIAARERGQRVPVWGGALLGRGLEWFPGPSFIFFFSLLLNLFYFLISFIDFVKCSKSIQTTFRNFVKITARF